MHRDGLEREKSLWADLDAVVAGGALVGIHYRQAVGVHVDGVEVADLGTVGEPEAAPGAVLAAAAHHRRGAAGSVAGVARTHVGDMAAAGVPIGRYADPEEVAEAIEFLTSERNTYTSGVFWEVPNNAR